MKPSTYWLDKLVGGRCSPKHHEFVASEISENVSILCLEENIPQQDRFLIELGRRVIHLPFPKIQPAQSDSDKLLASKILIKGLGIITKAASEFKSDKIIVHCGHGNDRTGLILLGYMILSRGLNFDEAMRHLKYHNNEALTYPGFEELANNLFQI